MDQPPKSSPEEIKPLTGREGLDLLKSSASSVEGVRLVDFLKTSEGQEVMKNKKIVLAGPPRSGKSCLRQGLKESIKEIGKGEVYPYVLTACPDGEGAWFQESMNNNPELASKYKAEYKSKFSPEFVHRVAESVKNLSLPLNFIDIGGMITPENAEICAHANGAILLCGETAVKNNLPAEWKKFFTELKIPIVAEIYSDYKGSGDIIEGVGEDGVFRGSVHHLERGEVLKDRETIRALSEFIINFGKERKDLVSLDNVKHQLQDSGVDFSSWGKEAGSKPIESLYHEIEEGETVLEKNLKGELVRKVIVGNVSVFFFTPEGKKYRLTEEKQIFTDGRVRERKLGLHAVSEKIKHGEDVEDAILRGVKEELGIEGDFTMESKGVEKEEVPSPSYPGLRTEYVLPKFHIFLTPEQFKKEGYQEIQKDKTTYFIWIEE